MSEAAQTQSNPRHKWYIVHAYSNFEKKVAESIREQAKAQGLEEQFSDILVPLPGMGVEVRFEPGPRLGHAIRSAADVDALRVPDARETTARSTHSTRTASYYTSAVVTARQSGSRSPHMC